MDGQEVVFETRYFKVVALAQPDGDPYYMLELPDYVCVVALTAARHVLFVRQFRPIVRQQTIELPSGHIEKDESPEDAARRELLEETGFVAPRLELLGTLIPDVGRLGNRMWCFFAPDVTPCEGTPEREEGVSVIELPEHEALGCAADGRMDHALHLGALMLALTGRKLFLD
jgi:ADP-ribose pyrophosphatase